MAKLEPRREANPAARLDVEVAREVDQAAYLLSSRCAHRTHIGTDVVLLVAVQRGTNGRNLLPDVRVVVAVELLA